MPAPADDDDLPLEVDDPIAQPTVDARGHDPARDLVHARRHDPARDLAAGLPRDGLVHGDLAPAETAAARPPPRWAFWSGIFGFPFQSGVWPRWLLLSSMLFLALLLLSGAGQLASGAPGKSWAISLICLVLSYFVILVWSVTAAASGLAILQGTAAGSDEIEWPDALWIDWISDCFYVVNPLCVSILAGWGSVWLLDLVGRPYGPVGPWTAFVLFPIVQLSMLETASPLIPVSRPVLHCLVRYWWAWGIVFGEAGILLAAVLWSVGQIPMSSGPGAAAVMAPLVVATWMIYCRLWGRLVWYCAQHGAFDIESEDVEEERDPEELRPRRA
ncbi:MAG: hypothetical protein A2W31_11305 [Planctomycetes bacterium RBG_16_64_10]|nr:MAG: hypothetical protein A2W31_11305 [Planctomycetes bacterium RBG_16_64_10]